MALAGDDPLDAARRTRTGSGTHLKDLRQEVIERVHAESLSFADAIEAGVFTVPGDGTIDFVPILEALGPGRLRRLAGRGGRAGRPRRNPLEYALKGRRYLHDVLGW